MESLGLRWRQTRFNPLRSLTPERLASALDQWAAGWLRDAALIFETIEGREAIIKSVMGKRRAAVARRDWQIIVPDAEDPNAEAHKATLLYFYNNLTTTDATDGNVRTGMSGLLRQMMDAVLQKYAVHEIIWKPSEGGMTAELRRVPLYFFENRTGKLKFVGVENRSDGMPLEEDGWMITVGDGLGEALSILYQFKRLGVQDLISFSEKFSVPGVLGRTSAQKDSDEGRAMRDSVLAYASDWVGVTYSDDGSIKNPIEIMQTPSSGTLPPMSIIEYMDRAIATLVRGGDLSTISRSEGTGSNPQAEETDALLQDDCAMISETLQTQLDRLVIRMVHGDEKPAAYIVVNPPGDEDLTRDLAIDTGLVKLGVKQDPADLAERYGREIVEEAEKPETRYQKPEKEKTEEDIAAENAYNPLQARAPKGEPDGGRWTKGALSDKSHGIDNKTPGGADIGDGTLPVDSAVTPEMDAAYLGAVERGDKDSAIELLNQAAKLEAEKITDRFISAIEADGGNNYYGIRAIDGHTVVVGENLRNSAVWVDGNRTEEELPGTSSILVEGDRETMVRAMNLMGINPKGFGKKTGGSYSGQQPALISGSSAQGGEDLGETVLGDAVVLDVVRKPETYTSYSKFGSDNNVFKRDTSGRLIPLSRRFDQSSSASSGEPTENAAGVVGIANEAAYFQTDKLRISLAADLQPLGDALFAAFNAGDEAAMKAALKKISKDMPDFLESTALAEAMGVELLTALTETDEN